MLSIALAAALAAAQPASSPNQTEACRAVGVRSAQAPVRRPSLRRLDRLPPAVQARAVLYSVGGCQLAQVVRYDPRTGERQVILAPAPGRPAARPAR